MVTTRNVGRHQFNFVGVIEPALDDAGRIAEYIHALPSKVRPNRYAGSPFCRFRLTGAPRRSGVYVITAADDLQYVGECENLAARFGSTGYGAISARNCHSDGQATNCKINSLVLSTAKSGQVVGIWFFETAERKTVEAETLGLVGSALERREASNIGCQRDGTKDDEVDDGGSDG